ncbi:MAG: alpha/beta hydrolase [Bacteroidota bacterium]
MHKALISVLFYLLSCSLLLAQNTLAEKGIREFSLYKPGQEGDTIKYWIKSYKGEENIRKPLMFFCQGSLARPMGLIRDDKLSAIVFPFLFEDEFLKNVHLVVAAKPGVPTVASIESLDRRYNYLENGKIPKKFIQNDFLEFYVERDVYLIKHLMKQDWVDESKLVLAGHSQGSHIALSIGEKIPQTSHLIYSGGSPFGRVMRTIQQYRNAEKDSSLTSSVFDHWQKVVSEPDRIDPEQQGDSYKSEYSFNQTQFEKLLAQPYEILVTYGTKDESAIFNDLLRIEAIKRRKRNISFIPVVGTEHNFFPVAEDGSVNRNVFNWDKVAKQWFDWCCSDD